MNEENADIGNMGFCNAGIANEGSFNAGSFNAGSHNTGVHNMGSYNVGSHNKGSFNIGNCNCGSYCYGHFNTKSNIGTKDNIACFNKLTGLNEHEFRCQYGDILKEIESGNRTRVSALPGYTTKSYRSITNKNTIEDLIAMDIAPNRWRERDSI